MSTAVPTRKAKPAPVATPPAAPPVAPTPPPGATTAQTPDAGLGLDRWALWIWLFGAAIMILWHVGDFLYGMWLRR